MKVQLLLFLRTANSSQEPEQVSVQLSQSRFLQLDSDEKPEVGPLYGRLQRKKPEMIEWDSETSVSHTRPASYQLVVHASSITQVISHLLLQDMERLLSSSFLRLRLTEIKEVNSLLQPTSIYQMAESILGRLEELLGPRAVLERALSDSSLVLRTYIVQLSALSIAQLVPDQLSDDQEDERRTVSVGDCLPVPATLSVSSDFAEDLLIHLILKLHPLNGFSARQLDQQQLLALCLHLGAVTLEVLRRIPGVIVDTGLHPPPCNIRRATVLLQSSLIRTFGTSIQVKKRMANRDPALLCSIPQALIEAVLTTYKSVSQAYLTKDTIPSSAAAREENKMENWLFSQPLPDSMREKLFQQFGTWIRNTKLFQRALPKMSDQDILEYRRRVTEPCVSNRDVVWVDGKYFVGDDYEEVVTSPNFLAENYVALNSDPAAFLKQFPNTDIFEETKAACDEVEWWGTSGKSEEQELCAPEVKHLKPACHFSQHLPSPPAQPFAVDPDDVKPVLATQRASVQESTVRQIVAELFKGKDRTYHRPQYLKNWAFEREMVQHIHLLLQKQAAKYSRDRLFLRTLDHLTDPQQEIKFSQEVAGPLKVVLDQAMPYCWLSREALMENLPIALLACRIIAAEVLKHLRPSVSFAADTKAGDETPYSFNIPVKKEEREDSAPTRLELHLQQESERSMDELCATEEEVPAAEPKKTRWSAWLRAFKMQKNIDSPTQHPSPNPCN